MRSRCLQLRPPPKGCPLRPNGTGIKRAHRTDQHVDRGGRSRPTVGQAGRLALVAGRPTEAHPRRHEKGVTRAMRDMGIRDQAGYQTRRVNAAGGPGAGREDRVNRHEVGATKGGHAGLLGSPRRGRGHVRSLWGSAGQAPGGRDTVGQRRAGRQGRPGPKGTTAAAAAAELRQRPSCRGRRRPNGKPPETEKDIGEPAEVH